MNHKELSRYASIFLIMAAIVLLFDFITKRNDGDFIWLGLVILSSIYNVGASISKQLTNTN